jgi:hypothetical protein
VKFSQFNILSFFSFFLLSFFFSFFFISSLFSSLLYFHTYWFRAEQDGTKLAVQVTPEAWTAHIFFFSFQFFVSFVFLSPLPPLPPLPPLLPLFLICIDTPIVYISAYGPEAQTDAWTLYTIPLADLQTTGTFSLLFLSLSSLTLFFFITYFFYRCIADADR